MSHNPFLPEDAWKHEAVQRGLDEYLRNDYARLQQKIQEGVLRLIEGKEETNHNL